MAIDLETLSGIPDRIAVAVDDVKVAAISAGARAVASIGSSPTRPRRGHFSPCTLTRRTSRTRESTRGTCTAKQAGNGSDVLDGKTMDQKVRETVFPMPDSSARVAPIRVSAVLPSPSRHFA
jgi:hypothetical protein